MSILAGVVSWNPKYPVLDATCERIKRIISRYPGEELTSYRDDGCFLTKIDVGAYGHPAFHQTQSGSVSMLVGDPILTGNRENGSRTRADDLRILHEAWDADDWESLKRVQGVFSAVFYTPHHRRLSLISDKLGFRPLYYYVEEKRIFFSSAIRILEDLPEVAKKMDVRTVTEISSLGFPLSHRTPYVGVSRLEAAEIRSFSAESESRLTYWQWDRVPTSKESEEKQLAQAHRLFQSAVVNRLGTDTSTICLLSGGLDSRLVAAALREHNAVVHTFNYAPPGSQDRAFGALLAEAIGTIHKEVDLSQTAGRPFDDILAALAAWNESKERKEWPAERPRLVWLGGGGSVGLGHVYMDSVLVELMRKKEFEAAVDYYIRKQRFTLLHRLLNPGIVDSLSDILKTGILEQLSNVSCEDPARDFYLFLMLQEQRCLLSDHYEEIDVRRVDFRLPFMDSDFMAAIVAVPVDLCLNHHFYHDLLKHFSAPVSSVPWQTYPGHEPCPLPAPPGLLYQWEGDSRPDPIAKSKKSRLLGLAKEMLKPGNFPDPILNSFFFRLFMWAYRAGLRDYGYVIDKTKIYYQYWKRSEGRYLLP
jgi:asparagine synthase (glutamine-hydrolysing)